MKNLYVLITVLIISGHISAQSVHQPFNKAMLRSNSYIKTQSNKVNGTINLNHKNINKLEKGSKGPESKWFSYAGVWEDSLYKNKPTDNLWGDILYTDETNYVGTGDYHFNPWLMGMAVVLDPGAPIFKKMNINRTTAYKIDSIAMYATYERHYKDADVVDTLIAEVITNYYGAFDGFSGMKTLYPPYLNDIIYFGRVLHDSKFNFDKTSTDNIINSAPYNLPYKTKVSTYKIKLTKETAKDTMPGSGGIIRIQFPTPSSSTDSLFSIVTFRFKPGYKTVAKDTIMKNGNLFQFLSFQERGADTYPYYDINDFNVSYTLPFADLLTGTGWENEYLPSYFFSKPPTTLQNHLVEFHLSYDYCPCTVAFDPQVTKSLICGDKSQLKTTIDVCNTTTTYKWSPAAGLSSTTASMPTASPSSTTTYTVTVTSGNCTASNSIKITVNPLTVNTTGNQTITCGESANLSATTNQTSGTLTYKWSPSASLSSATVSNPVATPISTTTYKVTASSGGCLATATVTVTVKPKYTADAGLNKTISCGDSIQLNAVVTPATSGLTYTWSQGSSLSATDVANPYAFPTSTTKYKVTVSDPNGGDCKPAIDSITVTVTKPNFKVKFAADNTSPYSEPPYLVKFTNQTPKLGKYKFTWDFGDGTAPVNSNNLVTNHTYQLNGTYSVKLKAAITGSPCGGDSLVETNYITCSSSTSVPVGNIVITPDTLRVGKSYSKTFNVQILPSTATNKNVTWKINDDKIAYIDNTGQVTGLNYGTTKVTCVTIDGGKTSSATVVVYNAEGISEYNSNVVKVNCRPNPFNAQTSINYTLLDNAFVTIKIYDMIGNEIKTLVNENKARGEHSEIFDGSGLESGVYYYSIKTNNNIITGKMTMIN